MVSTVPTTVSNWVVLWSCFHCWRLFRSLCLWDQLYEWCRRPRGLVVDLRAFQISNHPKNESNSNELHTYRFWKEYWRFVRVSWHFLASQCRLLSWTDWLITFFSSHGWFSNNCDVPNTRGTCICNLEEKWGISAISMIWCLISGYPQEYDNSSVGEEEHFEMRHLWSALGDWQVSI